MAAALILLYGLAALYVDGSLKTRGESTQPRRPPADTLGMVTSKLETAFWIGALAARVHGARAHLDGELAALAERMLARWRPRAKC